MKQKDKIKRLEKEVIDLKLKQHTKSYIHISWKVIGRLFAFLGCLGLAIFNFFIILSNWTVLQLGSLNESDIKGFYQLGIIPMFLVEYLLIGLVFICLIALIKGGFNKIKSYNEEGLIYGLIVGLIVGLILGLIIGLLSGLLGGLIYGLIVGLILGLLGWLIVGLIVGLIIGLLGGLIYGLLGWLIYGLIGGLIYGLIYGLLGEFE